MDITGLIWLGVRTDRFDAQRDFYRDVMHLPRVLDEPDYAIFGPSDQEHRHFSTGPVAGFGVASVGAARAALVAAGIVVLGEGQTENGTYAWVHFRGPDGNVYEVAGPP